MLTDHEFITPSEKTQCQVHLTSEKAQGNLPQCSHTKESRVKKHIPTEKAFPQDINQFKEKVKLSSGSLIRKKLDSRQKVSQLVPIWFLASMILGRV